MTTLEVWVDVANAYRRDFPLTRAMDQPLAERCCSAEFCQRSQEKEVTSYLLNRLVVKRLDSKMAGRSIQRSKALATRRLTVANIKNVMILLGMYPMNGKLESITNAPSVNNNEKCTR